MSIASALSTRRAVRCPGTGCSVGAHGAAAKPGHVAYKEFGKGPGGRGFTVKYKRCQNRCDKGRIRARGVA